MLLRLYIFLMFACSSVNTVQSNVSVVNKLPRITPASFCNEDFELSQKYYKVQFGDVINFEIKNATGAEASWRLVENTTELKTGKGDASGDLTFDRPSVFKIIFSANKDGVNHSDEATIDVLPTKIKFNMDEAVLSAPVFQNKPTDSITLKIPVDVFSYDKHPVTYGPYSASSTGIDGIKASLVTPVALKHGKQFVTYNLSGSAKHSGTARLGFFSPVGEGFFYTISVTKNK